MEPDPRAPKAPMQIPYRAELKRKALHVLALIVPYFIAVNGKSALVILVPLAVIAVLADYFRTRSEAFARLILRIFGFMMRVEEAASLGGSVKINGATWVLVTATLLTVIFPVYIAVTAFVMAMLADAMAAIIGRRYGSHRWPGAQHTVEGSVAFVATGLLVAAAVPFLTFWVGIVAVLVAAVVEALPGPLDDNIRVPVAAAVTIFALERFVLDAPIALFALS